MSEFAEAVAAYRDILCARIAKERINVVNNKFEVKTEWDHELCDEKETKQEPHNITPKSLEQGKLLSAAGPAPYTGDILENTDLVWADDVWTPEKEAMAIEKLKQQGSNKVSEYWRSKYVREAGRYWHFFYQRNEDHFYKDRHYLHIVFPELLNQPCEGNDRIHLLEVGSGVGNAIWPLLELNAAMEVVAIDFAKSAIDLLNKRSLQQENLDNLGVPRAHGYVHSIIANPEAIPLPITGGFDLALCMFVLSAIAPEHHLLAFQNIYSILRHTGRSRLMIRDYGRYDEAQLRFKADSKLEDNFYVRQDGTCSFFFRLEELIAMAESVGFKCEEAFYIHRQYANRHQKQARYRVWVHAKFSC